jgi:Histidine kinase-, DNA gyrase B-, and HSP90-like ATPase
MKAKGVEHLVERAYREGGRYQWLRETVVNSLEAGATRIEFSTEWQAVQSRGIHRRIIADNGRGMTQAELKGFFNTFGAGSKTIGPVHENFGVGAKTSLLPWNKAGVVVLSRSREVPGITHRIWLLYDESSGQYGLKEIPALNEYGQEVRESAVIVGDSWIDEDLGLDWAQLVPDWLKDQGTVILLLGNSSDEDTVLGDTSKGEFAPNQIAAYLNERLWDLPPGVKLRTREYWSKEKLQWPTREAWKQGDNKVNTRLIHGTKYYLGPSQGAERTGKVFLSDGTRVHWYLWDEAPSSQTHRPGAGFLAVLYRGELYDVRRNHHAFRHFGIALKKLRERLVLIIQPREYDERTQTGAYPRHDRNALLFKSGPAAGHAPPLEIWGEEFVENFPPALRKELNKVYGDQTQTIDDSKWRKRLQSRFGSRWKVPSLRSSPDPSEAGIPIDRRSHLPSAPMRHSRKKVISKQREPEGQLRLGESATLNAKPRLAPGGLPGFRLVGGEEFDDGILARWAPNDPEHPEGVIFINADHLVIEELSKYWGDRYPTAPPLKWDIAHVYGQVAVAKIAHSEQMKRLISVDKVEDEMRTDLALTMSLLGLYSEDSLIRSFLSGKYGRQKATKSE